MARRDVPQAAPSDGEGWEADMDSDTPLRPYTVRIRISSLFYCTVQSNLGRRRPDRIMGGLLRKKKKQMQK